MDYFQEEDQPNSLDDDLNEEDWGESSEDLEYISFVCEDCDYRWEEVTQDEMDTDTVVCPMCGSINVTQL